MARTTENFDGDNGYEEFLKGEKHIKCPWCRAIIMKGYGNNVMICRCGARICFSCSKLLDHENPYLHFKANGGSDCELFDLPDDLETE